MERKFNLKRLLITLLFVILAAGTVGGSTYYVMGVQSKKEKEEFEKQITALEKQVNEVTKKDKGAAVKEKTVDSRTDTVLPNVAVTGTLKRSGEAWVFKFSEKMDVSTVKVGNINLYAVSGSVGTAGRKDLSNDILTEFGLNYDQKDFVLTIPVKNEEYLSCASCTWEFEFTDKIKDSSGNTLKAISFKMN